jgi:hypothetical protein
MQLHNIETFLSFQDVEIKLVHHHLTVATIQKGTLKLVSNSETFQHLNPEFQLAGEQNSPPDRIAPR